MFKLKKSSYPPLKQNIIQQFPLESHLPWQDLSFVNKLIDGDYTDDAQKLVSCWPLLYKSCHQDLYIYI